MILFLTKFDIGIIMTKYVKKDQITKGERPFQTFEGLLDIFQESKVSIDEIGMKMKADKKNLKFQLIGFNQGKFVMSESSSLNIPTNQEFEFDLFRIKLKKDSKKKTRFPYELDSFDINIGMFKGKFKKK